MYLADNVSDNTAELLQSLSRKLHDSFSPAVSLSGRDSGARILRAGRDRTKNDGVRFLIDVFFLCFPTVVTVSPDVYGCSQNTYPTRLPKPAWSEMLD